jgi:hypothetical protein
MLECACVCVRVCVSVCALKWKKKEKIKNILGGGRRCQEEAPPGPAAVGPREEAPSGPTAVDPREKAGWEEARGLAWGGEVGGVGRAGPWQRGARRRRRLEAKFRQPPGILRFKSKIYPSPRCRFHV